MNNDELPVNRLRNGWGATGKALGEKTIGKHTDRLLPNINNRQTSLDRLREVYMRLTIFALCAGIGFVPFFLYYGNKGLLAPNLTPAVAISYGIIMIGSSILNFWFWKGTGKINPLTMTVSQVASLAAYYRKCHIRWKKGGLPIAILWVGFFIYAASQSDFVFILGVAAGGGIGALWGINRFRRFMNEYRELSK